MAQDYEITPRKRPSQARAVATFDALIDACARLLPELGYDGVTTNAIAERAGVGIGSLYEYFPGKDAIIAIVVERLIDRVMARLASAIESILAAQLPEPEGVERWIGAIHDTIEAERPLIAVLMTQVPYLRQLQVVQDLPATLLAFSERARDASKIELRQSTAALMLINNLVSTTILQVVLAPPQSPALPGTVGVTKAELIAMLTAHVNDLLAASRAQT